VETVNAALGDPLLPAKHILISGGTPRPEDYSYEKTVYRAITENFPQVPVDIMMTPYPHLLDPKELKSLGVNGLSINIEVFSHEARKRLIPIKMRLGMPYYLDFIESAVEIFGMNHVQSLIIVGLESLEDTLRGVDALASRGCQPVLSPFRPDPATPLGDYPPPDTSLLEKAYLESLEIATKRDVKLGPRCIPCHHNTLTFPDGSDFYFYN
jgi:biotin synthase-related radical SAM superfamily protein